MYRQDITFLTTRSEKQSITARVVFSAALRSPCMWRASVRARPVPERAEALSRPYLAAGAEGTKSSLAPTAPTHSHSHLSARSAVSGCSRQCDLDPRSPPRLPPRPAVFVAVALLAAFHAPGVSCLRGAELRRLSSVPVPAIPPNHDAAETLSPSTTQKIIPSSSSSMTRSMLLPRHRPTPIPLPTTAITGNRRHEPSTALRPRPRRRPRPRPRSPSSRLVLSAHHRGLPLLGRHGRAQLSICFFRQTGPSTANSNLTKLCFHHARRSTLCPELPARPLTTRSLASLPIAMLTAPSFAANAPDTV
ncbi:hypothetical protein BKA80DRAFT_91558 [Phyllosticta citrichinensis]